MSEYKRYPRINRAIMAPIIYPEERPDSTDSVNTKATLPFIVSIFYDTKLRQNL
jgi:hypothetical protein